MIVGEAFFEVPADDHSRIEIHESPGAALLLPMVRWRKSSVAPHSQTFQ
jgi:hypothetical protein